MANSEEAASLDDDPISYGLFDAARNAFFRGIFFTADYTMPEKFGADEKKRSRTQDNRYYIADIVLFPLSFIGACLGLTALPVLYYFAYIVLHCGISFYRSFARATNDATNDMFTIQNGKKIPYNLIPLENEKEIRSEWPLIAGLPGRLIGLILGKVMFITIMIARMIQNIPEHVFRIFCKSVCFMLPEKTPTHDFFTLKPDKRGQESYGYGSSYALGILGIFPLGIISVVLGLLVGAGLRAVIAVGLLFRRHPIKKPADTRDTTAGIEKENAVACSSSYGNAMNPLNDLTLTQSKISPTTPLSPKRAKKQPPAPPKSANRFFPLPSFGTLISNICTYSTQNNKTL